MKNFLRIVVKQFNDIMTDIIVQKLINNKSYSEKNKIGKKNNENDYKKIIDEESTDKMFKMMADHNQIVCRS